MPNASTKAAVGQAGATEGTAEPSELPRDRRIPPIAAGDAAIAVVVIAGIFLRFWARSPLWLDEALSVNTARLPLGEIPSALLRDGAPPLYYFLLHLWMQLFGSGDFAVRSLSGLFSVATLPAVWLGGRQLGAKNLARWALVIAASSPFAIRYATETRMYSLVVFLVAWGYLALRKSLREPTALSLAGVALSAATLALTHYWALYLIAVLGGVLVIRALRSADRRPTMMTLGAVAAGLVLWLPWAPKFFYQFQHTGTPWADAPPFGSVFNAVTFWAGGPLRTGPLLGLIFFALIALALFALPSGRGRLELRAGARPEATSLAIVVFGTLVVAYLAGVIGHSTFADRYTSVVWPPFVLLVALGVSALGNDRARNVLLAAIVGLGIINSVGNVSLLRTQAGHVARVIDKSSRAGDVVAFCPDQLGPAVSRLLDDGPEQLTYPDGAAPEFVDWVDYGDRNRASDPLKFVRLLESRTPAGGSIWLVSSPGYRTFGTKCQELKAELLTLHPEGETLIRRKAKSRAWEREELSVYPSP